MTYDGSASPVLGSKSMQGIRGTFQELFPGKCTIYTVYIVQQPGASNKMGLNFLISCQFVSLELAVAVLMHGSSNAVHVWHTLFWVLGLSCHGSKYLRRTKVKKYMVITNIRTPTATTVCTWSHKPKPDLSLLPYWRFVFTTVVTLRILGH